MRDRHSSILQIVPHLPPKFEGLGCYALELARQLRKDFGLTTHFIECDISSTSKTDIDGFQVKKVAARSKKTLFSALQERPDIRVIVLHYAGYGYAAKGCPFWLVDALREWKQSGENKKMVTVFHELYAVSRKPWKSLFWLVPFQKKIISMLLGLSEHCFTNRDGYVPMLKSLCSEKNLQISNCPVFSTVGELDRSAAFAKRNKVMVVFGGRHNRLEAYKHSLEGLQQACDELGISEILDIGPAIENMADKVNAIQIVRRGMLSNEEVHKIFSSAYAGFIRYPIDYLAKSSIFAAYCAHAIIPVVSGSGNNNSKSDGLVAGMHCWIPGKHAVSADQNDGGEIAQRAYEWYQKHSISVQAEAFAKIIDGESRI